MSGQGSTTPNVLNNPMSSEKSELRMVRDFMEAYDQPIRFRPVESLPIAEKLLRLQLIIEETWELADALGVTLGPKPLMVTKDTIVDPVASLDALTDLMYVTFGTYHTLGLADCASEAFREVHSSNMSKLDDSGRPIKNEHGKVLKGPYYFKPNLEVIVRQTQNRPTVFDMSQ